MSIGFLSWHDESLDSIGFNGSRRFSTGNIRSLHRRFGIALGIKKINGSMRIRFRSWHDESVRFKEFEWLTLIFNTFSSENYQSFTCHKNDEWAKNINL